MKCDEKCPYYNKLSGLCDKDDHFNPNNNCDRKEKNYGNKDS